MGQTNPKYPVGQTTRADSEILYLRSNINIIWTNKHIEAFNLMVIVLESFNTNTDRT
jgi:hypothetical protein